MIERHTITVTTDSGGGFTRFSPLSARGEVCQVCYTPDPSVSLDTNTTIALTGETTGIVIASHGSLGTTAFQRSYQLQKYDMDGTAGLYAAGGTKVRAPIVLAGERIKLAITGGGNTKKGTFDVYMNLL